MCYILILQFGRLRVQRSDRFQHEQLRNAGVAEMQAQLMQQRAECENIRLQAQSREKVQQDEVKLLRERVAEALKGTGELQKQIASLHAELESKEEERQELVRKGLTDSEGEAERTERLDRLEVEKSEAEAGKAEVEEKAGQMSEMLAAQNSLIITLKTKCQQFNKVLLPFPIAPPPHPCANTHTI
jgi:hypothetical protein